MAKNFTEEELEQDPFLQSYAKTTEFYNENKKVIIGSAVAVILAIALAIGYHYYQKSQNKKAQQLMSTAEVHYLRGEYDSALNGSNEDLTIGFEQVINNYGGTEAGNLARYYAAVCEYNLGNTEQALSYIEDYDLPDGILGVGPISFHALVLTELGRHQEAAEIYVNAAEWDKNQSTTPYNYLEAANAYLDAGDTENAQKCAEMVTDNYPNSAQVTEADRLLGRLMASTK